MPTTNFPIVNPVDPTSQLNAIQSAISTLQSTVNGLSSSNISPKRAYQGILVYTSYASGSYTSIVNASGAGSLNFVSVYHNNGNPYACIRIITDGSTYDVKGPHTIGANNNTAGRYLGAGAYYVLDYHGPIYFNSTLVVQIGNLFGSAGNMEAIADYALV